MMYFLSSEGISYKSRKFAYQFGSSIIIQDADLGVLHTHLSQSANSLCEHMLCSFRDSEQPECQ